MVVFRGGYGFRSRYKSLKLHKNISSWSRDIVIWLSEPQSKATTDVDYLQATTRWCLYFCKSAGPVQSTSRGTAHSTPRVAMHFDRQSRHKGVMTLSAILAILFTLTVKVSRWWAKIRLLHGNITETTAVGGDNQYPALCKTIQTLAPCHPSAKIRRRKYTCD